MIAMHVLSSILRRQYLNETMKFIEYSMFIEYGIVYRIWIVYRI